MKKHKKEVKQAFSEYNLCTALVDMSFDVEPNHIPKPCWLLDGGAACIECGGFVPNEKNNAE